MYTSHFGLLEAPFSITPDPQYLYMSERHREALAHLLYGIGEGGGFVVLTGEVGAGKTTICRCLLRQLPPDVDVALVLNPRLTALELLATLCDELRLSYPTDTVSTKVLVETLYRHMLDAHERGRRTVLIIDEAQNLGTEALEQVRLLTNLETTKQKLLQVILIGQPELATALEQPALRQLAQRITARYHLDALSAHETSAYIAHRLGVAGRHDTVFRAGALREVHRLTRGVPRLINVVCDRALLGAYAADRTTIDSATVRKAAGEVFGRRQGRRYVGAAAAAAALVLLALLAGVLFWPPLRDVRRFARLASDTYDRPPIQSTVTTPAPEASVAPALSTALPPPPQLRDLLADPTMEADQRAAFAALYARWNPDDTRAASVQSCERARQLGLSCLSRTGTWTKVRRFDVPAVFELAGPLNEKRYATVIALDGDMATLALGQRRISFPLREVDAVWDGPFMVLWKRPALAAPVIVPGAQGKDVQWLRQRLDELDGQPVAPGTRDVYDADLQRRVRAFQRSRSLVADAIVGEETLAHLTLARSDGRPSLTASKP